MLAVYQGAAAFGDKAANLDTIERITGAARAAGARLVVFPELFLSGYNIGTEAHNLAEPVDGPSIDRARAIAKGADTAIAFGFPERDNGSLYNSAAFIDGAGEIRCVYRKVNLYDPLEGKAFVRGKGLGVVELGPWKVGLVICYDIEFPEVARKLTQDGCNLIIVPTANMDPFTEVPTALVRARALENAICVAYANLSGVEGGLVYTGLSGIVGPDGCDLARAGRTSEALLIADVTAALADPGTKPSQSTQLADLREDLL